MNSWSHFVGHEKRLGQVGRTSEVRLTSSRTNEEVKVYP